MSLLGAHVHEVRTELFGCLLFTVVIPRPTAPTLFFTSQVTKPEVDSDEALVVSSLSSSTRKLAYPALSLFR